MHTQQQRRDPRSPWRVRQEPAVPAAGHTFSPALAPGPDLLSPLGGYEGTLDTVHLDSLSSADFAFTAFLQMFLWMGHYITGR